jgi:hypothetical protein
MTVSAEKVRASAPPADAPVWLNHAYEMYGTGGYIGGCELDEENDSICRNPFDPTQWIRQWHLEFDLEDQGLTAHKMLRTGERELKLFAKLGGAALPQREHYIANPGFDGAPEPTLYSVTEHINGFDLSGAETTDHPRLLVALHGLADALAAYYDGAKAAPGRYILSDIAPLRNYTFGWVGDECREPRIYLHDVQPYLRRFNYGDRNIVEQLDTFYTWSEQLQPLPDTGKAA